MGLKSFFEPASVAVIGASTKPGKLGHEILRNIVEAGFKGGIYPINPKADEILGLKCYPSIKEAPEGVELAVVIVPSKLVPSVIGDCGEKGIRAAIVISGGFSETGKEGGEIERQMIETAKRLGIRIIGPNCQGVSSTSVGLCASWPLVKAKGPISVISQSGTVLAALACWAIEEGMGVSKLVALGNKCDVNEIELLEFLANDPETKVIALYIEGTRDGRKFVEVAREASDKKPVIVLKSGRTAKGAEAVASHTRSLAGMDTIFDAAFKQARAIRVGGVEELYDACKGFACLPHPKGDGVVIVTSSGGSGILATDACEGLGLKLVDMPEKVRNTLREKLPPACILRNPLDLTGSATSQMYDDALTALEAAPEVHSIIVIIGDPMPGITDVISKHFGRGKVIVPVMLGGGEAEAVERKKLQKIHIPVYPSPLRGARALAILRRYAKVKGRGGT